jgi:hypothetical protein
MTTIRAHVPVETPAGLMVALPPCQQPLCRDGRLHHPDAPYIDMGPCPCRPDVFALAVPCPTQDPLDGRRRNCRKCNGTGWVLHGRYRVLDVLPIVEYVDDCTDSIDLIECVGINGPSLWRADNDWAPWCDIDLPVAVPGGVALIVEQVT